MATIKAYTDISQSKKLAEILPIESADMFYDGVQDLYEEKTYNIPMNGSSITVRTGHIITEKGIKANLLLPAWSLAALLKVIPKHIKDYNVLRIDISENDTSIWYDEIGYGVNNDLPDTTKDNPIDACYELILKLNKLNLL